ncbi:MAG: hypothetical protein NC218_06465 [Acetobacter sp.]|nr:hypothetical protein [Acetobacter sp.]
MVTKDNSHIKLGKRVKKSKEHPLGWEYINIIPKDIACIIALPGSNADNSKKANGFAKMIEETLMDKSLPIFSVEYNFGERIFRIDREALLSQYGQEDKNGKFIRCVKEEDKTYIPQYIRELYAKTIAPRLRDDNGKQAPIQQAAQNLNMLVFADHCQGSTISFQLERLMDADMKQLGYPEKTRDYLFKQIHNIAVAPVTPYGITKTTTFKFVSLDDEVAMSVRTPQIQHILRRKHEHQRYLDGISGNETERQSSNKPFTMQFSMFCPSGNETVFAVNNMYPIDIQQDPDYEGIEHTFAPYSDRDDDDRTKQGDLLSRTFRTTLNWLAAHAKKNETEFVELHNISQEKNLSPLFKQAKNNRYNFITRETSLLKARRSKDTR